MNSSSNPVNQPPSWLRWLGNDAARAILPDNDQGPIGCHFFQDVEEDIWEVSIFVSSTEIVGGPLDGTNVTPEIQLDVNALIDLFDETPRIFWQAEAVEDDDDLAEHMSFDGTARGRRVWLRVLKQAPLVAGPGQLLHSLTGEVETLW